MLIDLHTHTLFSDGLMTVNELVKKAFQKKVKLLSLTDHDTVSGLPLFLKLCKQYKIEAIPGIEFSTELEKQDLHILAYNINYKSPILLKCLKDQQDKRQARATIAIKKFIKAGFKISEADIKKLLKQSNVGKPQLSRVILKSKYNLNLLKKQFNFEGGLSDFIGKFLEKPGQIGYVAIKRLNTLIAIKIIKKSNGYSVLAHPDLELINHTQAEYFIKKLKAAGLSGIEKPHNHPEQAVYFKKLTNSHQLITTYGSDTHDFKRLGVEVTKEELEEIKSLL